MMSATTFAQVEQPPHRALKDVAFCVGGRWKWALESGKRNLKRKMNFEFSRVIKASSGVSILSATLIAQGAA